MDRMQQLLKKSRASLADQLTASVVGASFDPHDKVHLQKMADYLATPRAVNRLMWNGLEDYVIS